VTLDELADTMAMLARPGIGVTAVGDHVRIALLHRTDPGIELVVFRATPSAADWSGDVAVILRSFDQFNDVATVIADHAVPSDDPLSLAQDVYEKGILMSAWYDVMVFEYESIDESSAHWSRS